MADISNPLIIQSDNSILLETAHPLSEEIRDHLVLFAELIKSPEHIHTYRLTPLSLWNAAASGVSEKFVLETLRKYAKYAVPENVVYDIRDNLERYGKIRLEKHPSDPDRLLLVSEDTFLLREIRHQKNAKPFIERIEGENALVVAKAHRGVIKQALIKAGFPVEDRAGYVTGEPYELDLRPQSLKGKTFALREYQQEAVDSFYAGGSIHGGNGVVVLPCGAGKTVVAMAAIARLKTSTLILVTNITAARQWIEELIDKTTVRPDDIAEYSGEMKAIKPITVATYQILTHRKNKNDPFLHFPVFDSRNWGLVVYDEVHLLPAPVFQMAAHLQARRRLGLTATLVREDHREDDVFSLIGPKKYDVPWKVLEKQGWIAKAECVEIKIPLNSKLKNSYAVATDRNKFTLASTNPDKLRVIKALIAKHREDNILVIGQYLDQLEKLSTDLQAPIITGKTKNSERAILYGRFKTGELKLLIVSKVANFAVDLPDANVAIQISGTFGSRQEEAQRLGRILRPKSDENRAHFYSVISKATVEEDFALKRQLFLTEQGYKYKIENAV
jgi:DNA excision repair protein ERCC-3